MKNASKAMYTIGRIFNIIALIGMIIVLIVGIVLIAKDGTAVAQDENGVDVEVSGRALGIILLSIGVAFSVVYVVLFLLAGHASKALNNGRKDNVPHVIMIIIGVFGDIFYLLGGIFGLVAEHEEADAPKEDTPQE